MTGRPALRGRVAGGFQMLRQTMHQHVHRAGQHIAARRIHRLRPVSGQTSPHFQDLAVLKGNIRGKYAVRAHHDAALKHGSHASLPVWSMIAAPAADPDRCASA